MLLWLTFMNSAFSAVPRAIPCGKGLGLDPVKTADELESSFQRLGTHPATLMSQEECEEFWQLSSHRRDEFETDEERVARKEAARAMHDSFSDKIRPEHRRVFGDQAEVLQAQIRSLNATLAFNGRSWSLPEFDMESSCFPYVEVKIRPVPKFDAKVVRWPSDAKRPSLDEVQHEAKDVDQIGIGDYRTTWAIRKYGENNIRTIRRVKTKGEVLLKPIDDDYLQILSAPLCPRTIDDARKVREAGQTGTFELAGFACTVVSRDGDGSESPYGWRGDPIWACTADVALTDSVATTLSEPVRWGD